MLRFTCFCVASQCIFGKWLYLSFNKRIASHNYFFNSTCLFLKKCRFLLPLVHYTYFITCERNTHTHMHTGINLIFDNVTFDCFLLNPESISLGYFSKTKPINNY